MTGNRTWYCNKVKLYDFFLLVQSSSHGPCWTLKRNILDSKQNNFPPPDYRL